MMEKIKKAIKDIELPKLDTLVNEYRDKRYICEHIFPELTALCPITKLPDFYTVKLRYEPDEKIIETRSLKLYFIAFRDIEILQEELANRILDDFINTVRPKRAFIEVKANVRGGIYSTVSRYWSREEGDKPEKIGSILEKSMSLSEI